MSWLVLVAGCSLLVQFDPETQPCDSQMACLTNVITDGGVINYVCVDNRCRRSDGGVTTDAGAGDGGCTPTETVCGDGRDNDCDTFVDCADPDCNNSRCDDRNACTTGETCASNMCRNGTAVVCSNTTNPCRANAGACDTLTGACSFAPLADGTLCGAVTATRCCAGTCINTTVNPGNCGGCGLSCTSGQTCQAINMSGCITPEPIDTSARCTCAAGVACPPGQTCTNGLCKPTLASQCAAGQVVGDAGIACGGFCRY